MKFKAFLFDLNGTMIDDMQYHIKAWYGILNKLGASVSMEKVKEECYGKNDELLERFFPGRFSIPEKNKMSHEKETAYQQAFRPQLKLIEGLDQFLAEAKKRRIRMAIGSAAIMYNIDFVLKGLQIERYFDAIVSADHVEKSKPDPETYLKCASMLGIDPRDCLVFEDAPKGVEAALNAGMSAWVITLMHGKEDFAAYPNVIGYSDDYASASMVFESEGSKEDKS
jgi:beta-phosphoglucomutase